MKKLIVAIAALALCASLQAQVYNVQTLTNACSVAASGTLTGGTPTIDVRKQKDVAVQIVLGLPSSGTDVMTYTFERSVDGSNWETLAAKKTVVGIAATGATTSTTVTNINTYGCGYIRLASVANGSSSLALTNTVKYALKINAP